MSADTAAITLGGGRVIKPTRREEVAMRIWRALLAGKLRPGQRIKEVHLAEALGVSRPTVRESLQQLIHEGLLIQVPYKGTHVAQPTREELADLAEVRATLETMAVQAAPGPAQLGDGHGPGSAADPFRRPGLRRRGDHRGDPRAHPGKPGTSSSGDWSSLSLPRAPDHPRFRALGVRMRTRPAEAQKLT
jgi:biotin operon repressor